MSGIGNRKPNIRTKESPSTPICQDFRKHVQEMGIKIFIFISYILQTYILQYHTMTVHISPWSISCGIGAIVYRINFKILCKIKRIVMTGSGLISCLVFHKTTSSPLYSNLAKMDPAGPLLPCLSAFSHTPLCAEILVSSFHALLILTTLQDSAQALFSPRTLT